MSVEIPAFAVRAGLSILHVNLAILTQDILNNIGLPGSDKSITRIAGDASAMADLVATLETEYVAKRDAYKARIAELEAESKALGKIASDYWLAEQRAHVRSQLQKLI